MSYGFTRDNLLDLHYGENMSVCEIANMYGCHKDTVWLAMRRFGISPRGKIKKPLNSDMKATLITLYIEQRLSVREIGRIIGKSHDYVSQKLKDIGIDVEDRITALQSDRNPRWNGGKTMSAGYTEISSKKLPGFKKREHQIVMETYIGRELREGEVVHHIDGDKTNNNINNLALMDRTAHARLHLLERNKNDAQ